MLSFKIRVLSRCTGVFWKNSEAEKSRTWFSASEKTKENVTISVLNSREKSWCTVNAAVCDRGVGGAKLEIGNALCDAAQGKRLDDIRGTVGAVPRHEAL